MTEDTIVAIAFLTRFERDRVAATLAHCYPIADDGIFDQLVAQLDGLGIAAPSDDRLRRSNAMDDPCDLLPAAQGSPGQRRHQAKGERAPFRYPDRRR